MATQRILTSSPRDRPEGPCPWSILRWSAATISPRPRPCRSRGSSMPSKANPAPEILEPWLASARPSTPPRCGDRDGAGCPRCDPEPHLLSAHTIMKERTSTAPALGATSFAVDCLAEVERGRAGRTGRPAVFCRSCRGEGRRKWPLKRSSAARRRWRSRSWGRLTTWAGRAPASKAFNVGSHAGRPRCLGPWLADARRCSRAWRRRASGSPWSTWAADSRPATSRMSGRRRLWSGDLRGASTALRQPTAGDDHRARPRHGRQCRRDQGGGRSDQFASRPGRHPLGLSRHRKVPRPRRDHGGRVRYPILSPATATRSTCVLAGPTCELRRAYSTRRALSPADQPSDRRRGADGAAGPTPPPTPPNGFNGFAPLKPT